MLSTAKAEDEAKVTPSASSSAVRVNFLVERMGLSFHFMRDDFRRLGLHRREGVACAVLGKGAGAGEWKVRAADRDLVGDDAIKNLAASLHRERPVLVVGALPFRMRREQRRNIGDVVGDHQLLLARAEQERRM